MFGFAGMVSGKVRNEARRKDSCLGSPERQTTQFGETNVD